MRRLRLLLAAAALIVASLVAWASPVAADSSACSSYGCGVASGSFQSYGEHFFVCDNERDGYSVALRYTADGVHVHTLWNHSGSGTCVDYNKSYAEGTGIAYHVCVGHYSTRHIIDASCGDNVTDRA